MHILIVDDDARLRSFLIRGLVELDFTVAEASDAIEAREQIANLGEMLDLILLDITMPGEDGLTMLKDLRHKGIAIPVIVLSARQEVQDRVRGLELGADDYIVKPFAFDELLARIRAVRRRQENTPIMTWGALRLDLKHHGVHHANKKIDLSPREFSLLTVLLEAKGKILSRDNLLQKVWGIGLDPGTNTVDVTIGRLRKRLHASGPVRIETVVGQGYRLDTKGEESN
ncbi:MAG TPA: response regulator transcription factor [Planctomycetes bacterium]|jgi:DNA-binding response OmpR family regulator|nr:response regulator transcription factor [Planctomycetota bacterium]HIL37001.1 response regulator transcription factor [Planctomycetota bacterium]